MPCTGARHVVLPHTGPGIYRNHSGLSWGEGFRLNLSNPSLKSRRLHGLLCASQDKSKRRKERHAETKAAAAQDMEKTLALARLRSERLEREAAERRRALEASGLLPQSSKRFNNSYGYADALRRDHSSAAVMATARGASAAAVRGLSQRFKA